MHTLAPYSPLVASEFSRRRVLQAASAVAVGAATGLP